MTSTRSFALCYLYVWCWLLWGGTLAQAQWQQKMAIPSSLAFSPDSHFLAVGSIEGWLSPGDLRVWETQSGKLIHKERYVYGVESVAFSPDGKTLAVATIVDEAKNAVRLWNMRTWRVERELGGKQYINSIAISPDGKQLMAGSNMGENGETDYVYLWDLKRRRYRSLPHSDGQSQMLFSPRHHFILGGFYSGFNNDNSENLRAWSATGHFLWRHSQPGLTDIAFLPDGQHFIAGIAAPNKTAGALQLWDVATGHLLQTVKCPIGVYSVAVSPDGKTWASGDNHGVVHLWNAQTRRPIKTLPLHKDVVTKLMFSSDGRFLASLGFDNLVRLTALH